MMKSLLCFPAIGARVIVPYLRGFGATRFQTPSIARTCQQTALGSDLIALLDALGIQQAILAGYDWGGLASCVAAVLWPGTSDRPCLPGELRRA